MNKFVKIAVLPAFATLVAFSGPAMAQKTADTAAKPAAAAMHKKATHARVSPTVKKAQEALNASGAKLKVDGVEGPATRKALKAFQTAHKLKATGRLDKATRSALKV